MEQGVRLGFIIGWEVPDGSEVLSELPAKVLAAGRYLLGVQTEAHAIRMLRELKEHKEVALAFIAKNPSFDYVNNEAFFGSITTASVSTTYLIKVGQLGAEVEQVTPNQFSSLSPFLTALIKEHSRIYKWSTEIDNMISDIKINLAGTGKVRTKEAKSATIKALLESSLLSLPMVSHIKGNSVAEAKVEELVGLLDGILQKTQYKPLLQLSILLKNILYACKEPLQVEGKAEIES